MWYQSRQAKTVPLEPGSLLLLVGPNNCGKSACLREIQTWFAPPHQRASPTVIKSLEFARVTTDELVEFVGTVYPVSELPNGNLSVRMGTGQHQLPRNVGVEQLYQILDLPSESRSSAITSQPQAFTGYKRTTRSTSGECTCESRFRRRPAHQLGRRKQYWISRG